MRKLLRLKRKQELEDKEKESRVSQEAKSEIKGKKADNDDDINEKVED